MAIVEGLQSGLGTLVRKLRNDFIERASCKVVQFVRPLELFPLRIMLRNLPVAFSEGKHESAFQLSPHHHVLASLTGDYVKIYLLDSMPC